jgi:hypothetical protein
VADNPFQITDGEKNLEVSEKLKKDENEAERISRGFTQLKVDVSSFAVRLKQALEDAQLGMVKEVTDLQSKVRELEAKLQGYTTTVRSSFSNVDDGLTLRRQRNGLAIGAGVGVVVGGLALWGGLSATGILAPIALVGAAVRSYRLRYLQALMKYR